MAFQICQCDWKFAKFSPFGQGALGINTEIVSLYVSNVQILKEVKESKAVYKRAWKGKTWKSYEERKRGSWYYV